MHTVVNNINESIDALYQMQALFSKRPALERLIIRYSIEYDDGEGILRTDKVLINNTTLEYDEDEDSHLDATDLREILIWGINDHPTLPIFKEDIDVIVNIFDRIVDRESDSMVFDKDKIMKLGFKLYMR